MDIEINRRILVVDDDHRVLELYRYILAEEESRSFDHLIAKGDSGKRSCFELTMVDQGQAAVEAVHQSIDQGEPFAVVFLDMRMPPGWDGARTASEIRKIDPHVMIVIVTAFSDTDILQMRHDLGEGVLFLGKPFERDELYLLALSLCESWCRHEHNRKLIGQLEKGMEAHRVRQEEVEELMTQLEQSNLELAEANVVQIGLEEEIRQKAHELEQLATHDELTTLYNRRAFNERIEEELERARRGQGKIALLYLDLDGFKQVNDTMGHAAGDEVLTQFSDRLKQEVRTFDVAFRMGGDEFAMILGALNSQDEATLVADRILECVRQPLILSVGEASIGVSIGIALYPDHAVETRALVQMADDAMYQSKSAGKNCWTVAEYSTLDQGDAPPKGGESGIRLVLE